MFACLLGGEWNKHVYNIYILHGTAARVLTSGHPPGTQKHDIVGKACKPFGTAAMEIVEKQ